MSIGRIMRLRRQTLPVESEPSPPLFFDDTPPTADPELAHQLMALILSRRDKQRRYWNIPFGSFLPSSR